MKNFPILVSVLVLVLFAIILTGCISFRSDIEGKFSAASAKRTSSAPVSVFFYFSHLEQEMGYDAVPKVKTSISGFRDIFRESMKELKNITSFVTFTDCDNDINDVRRRRVLDSLKTANDFTIHFTIKKVNSFSSRLLGDIISYCTIAVIPYRFTWDYITTAEIFDASGKYYKTYTRNASLTTWSNITFVFVYPFYPSEGKIEEIYFESIHDIFAEIQYDGILTK